MKSLAVLSLLVASALSGDLPCGPGLIAVPKDADRFECLTVAESNHLESLERSKRFDADGSTRFFLWTQQTAEGVREELQLEDPASLRNSTFDPRNPTRILIHGWFNDWRMESVRGLSRAYLAKGAYNVIGIDWSAGASTILYHAARMRVGAVAATIAKQIRTLLKAGQHPAQIALIGHSLGAHVAGLTGKHFQTEPKLAAIVALDPAGPLFAGDRPAERVDANDAQYVEVIHTNMGLMSHRDAAVRNRAVGRTVVATTEPWSISTDHSSATPELHCTLADAVQRRLLMNSAMEPWPLWEVIPMIASKQK
uniref:Lipase domain-containing protein n=1 Tax=Anopheles farauti TaxID=69004 RepID=A0A182QR96_9DIPT